MLQDPGDDERDKTVFHNTIPDLQDQDHSVQYLDHSVQDQDQDQDWFFGLRPVLSYCAQDFPDREDTVLWGSFLGKRNDRLCANIYIFISPSNGSNTHTHTIKNRK